MNRPHAGPPQGPGIHKTNGPPDDMADDELVAKMREAPRPSEVVDWPGANPPEGFGPQYRIVIPPEDAHDDSRIEAHRNMKAVCAGKGIDISEWAQSEALQGVLGDMSAKEMLARVIYSAEPIKGSEELKGKPIYRRKFRNAADVSAILSKNEIEVLFGQFLIVDHRLGPRLNVLDKDDVEFWLRKLQRGLEADPLGTRAAAELGRLVLPDLVELILGLVRMVSSTGSPTPESPDESWPSSSDSTESTSSATDTSFSGEQPAESIIDDGAGS